MPGAQNKPRAQDPSTNARLPQGLVEAVDSGNYFSLTLSGASADLLARRMVLISHLSNFVYSMTLEVITVALPFLNEAVHGDVISYSFLKTINAAFQLAGCIPFGRFVDLYGGMAGLSLTHIATLVNAFMLWQSPNLLCLNLAMAPTIIQHGQQCTTTIIACESTASERAVAIGRLSISYGMGGMLGSLVGGFVTQSHGAASAVYLAVLFEVPLVCLLLVVTFTSGNRPAATDGHLFDKTRFGEIIRSPSIQRLLAIKAALAFGSGLFVENLEEFARCPFSLPSERIGMMKMLQLGTLALSQGVLVDILKKKPTRGVLLTSVAVTSLFFCVLGMVSASFASLVLLTAGATSGINVALVIIASELTVDTGPRDAGVVLGLDMALLMLAGLLCPLPSSGIFVNGGLEWVLVSANLVLAPLLLFLCFESHYRLD